MKGLLGLITVSAVQWGVGRLEAGSSKLFHELLAQGGSVPTSLGCPFTSTPHDLSCPTQIDNCFPKQSLF